VTMAKRPDLRPGLGPDDLDADLLAGDGPPEPDDATAPPLTEELDLHTFQPRDCADLVAEYLRAAQDAGLPRVRIVHGKGTGALRRIVHGVLDRHPAVQSYRLAGDRGGGWGATVVELQPRT
jgi:dsDNA-specific endonuclease/ATPase MutS2